MWAMHKPQHWARVPLGDTMHVAYQSVQELRQAAHQQACLPFGNPSTLCL